MSSLNMDKIAKAEGLIEDALWQCVQDDDRQKELAAYKEAKSILEELDVSTPEERRERDRVLSYCLMRIDETLINLGDDERGEERAREALELAIQSENKVQIARCHLSLGIRILSKGRVPEAEDQFRQIHKLSQEDKSEDMQQVLGWMFIVRTHILLGKSLYNQALAIAEHAAGILASIKNYAGLAAANKALARVHESLGNSSKAEECRRIAESFERKAKKERK